MSVYVAHTIYGGVPRATIGGLARPWSLGHGDARIPTFRRAMGCALRGLRGRQHSATDDRAEVRKAGLSSISGARMD